METSNRRHDIDWIRVIAIGLLLVYHIAIGFQPWGIMIGFITLEESWESLWVPMTMLNIWRIPLLFTVSGMGVYFAMRNRSWKQLIQERSRRILLPYLFGYFFIVPLHVYLWQDHYGFDTAYSVHTGHLWFLGNIFLYVLILLPLFFYLKGNEDGPLAKGIKRMMRTPLGHLPVLAAFMSEAWILDPRPFEMYAMTWHGFFLGLLAFFFGFCYVLAGRSFWDMVLKWRWMFLVLAVVFYVFRLVHFQSFAPNLLLAIESHCWILSVLAFGHKYLNRPGRTLSYLSRAAYPVYIVHMVVLYLGATIIFPLHISIPLKFVLLLAFTLVGCFALYELVIRRVNVIRPLFGLKGKGPLNNVATQWNESDNTLKQR